MDTSRFTPEGIAEVFPVFFEAAQSADSVGQLRKILASLLFQIELEASQNPEFNDAASIARIRDTAQVIRNMLKERSDKLAGFSVAQALFDLTHNQPRPDLQVGFYADFFHLLLGLQGLGSRKSLDDMHLSAIKEKGRPAAAMRSLQLDELRSEVDLRIARYTNGLDTRSIKRRRRHRDRILEILGASLDDWHDWRWQIQNIVQDPALLKKLVKLSREENVAVKLATRNNLPFGITPYYLSLMDDERSMRDASIRAQVIPPMSYVQQVINAPNTMELDFMGEEDTSPFDLITRRYPAICILKPFNTCPQICVYCQRNWEIDDAMAPGAFAGMQKIDEAIDWIRKHPSIHEVLVTGGDPLAMGNNTIDSILEKIAAIPSVDRIRIGSRTLVTMPMRISADLADILAKYRQLGRREVALTTHVQHPYEITPELVTAINHLRTRGIAVYNQLVYTYFVSKRFEASALRRHLRLVNIDPYYTFNTKGKNETNAYRVPISRLVQEQQEETRLLPGLERTDEAVFNVPRLGKNYLKSREHRDLLAVLPDGSRVYEFYSWEKNISNTAPTYPYTDISIFDYLTRLEADGENIAEYDTIWYYF